ncbi:MAG: pyridoxamine 5'-phosphate oxidase family protein [Ilumatobacteraceae bacterium]
MTDAPKDLASLFSGGDTVMVATRQGTFVDARPLTVAGVRAPTIEMLVDAATEWAAAVADGDQVLLSKSDNRSNTWVTVTGTLAISSEPAEIDRLWSPPAEAFFDEGRATPGIAVLAVEVVEGSYWTSPSGRLGSLISMVRAAVGDSDDSGEHGTVRA